MAIHGIIGRKVGMTQVFEADGTAVPVTVVQAGPCVVTQKKTIEKDQYESVQVGFGEIKESRLNKPERGHLAKNNLPARRHLKEFRMAGVGEASVGDEITVEGFSAGDVVDVTGVSKGKGFQGVVKRYHWHGGDMTHGSMVHRKPQSAGATDAARIFKGTGRPGHMGHERVTIRRLRVARVDAARNVLLIRGAIPGPNGSLVSIREAK